MTTNNVPELFNDVGADKQDRYWYFRFRYDFFYQTKIKDMLDMTDGSDIAIIYLKLCAEATPNRGVFKLVMESPEEFTMRLAKDIMTDPRVTARAIKYLTENELINISFEDRTISISVPSIELNTGKSSKEADQKKKKRLKESKRALLESGETRVYGEFHNVYLSKSEYTQLNERYKNADKIIQAVSIWKWRKQIEEHSDYALCLKFAMKDGIEKV